MTIAVTVVDGVPWPRRLPLRGAGWIADLGAERKGLALAYVLPRPPGGRAAPPRTAAGFRIDLVGNPVGAMIAS